MKQEASGFPENCQNEEDRQEYIRDYFEGIQLEYNNITKNEFVLLQNIFKLIVRKVGAEVRSSKNKGCYNNPRV